MHCGNFEGVLYVTPKLVMSEYKNEYVEFDKENTN